MWEPDGRHMELILPVKFDRATYKSAYFLYMYQHSHENTQQTMGTIKNLMPQLANYDKWYLLKSPSRLENPICFYLELTFFWKPSLMGHFLSQSSHQLHVSSGSSLMWQGDSWQVIMAEPNDLFSMRKEALGSTENGEVTLRAKS